MTRNGRGIIGLFKATAWTAAVGTAAACAALAAPAAGRAQSVPDDAIPAPNNVNDFRLAPDGTVAPPSPAPVPEPITPPTPAPATPAPPEPVPVVPPAAETPALDPIATPPDAAAPVRRFDRSRRVVRPAPAPRAQAAPTAPLADDPVAPAPADEVPGQAAPPAAEPVVPVAGDPVAASPEAEPASDASWWPLAALAGLAAVAALAFARRRRRTAVVETTEDETYVASEPADAQDEPLLLEDVVEPAPTVPHEADAAVRTLPVIDLPPVLAVAPAATEPQAQDAELAAQTDAMPTPIEPEAAVASASAIEPAVAPRPRLELAFAPAGASATDAQAAVQFVLTVSNLGDAPALRVRMEARMFAMGEDHDAALAAFFSQPLERATPIASTIPAGVSTELRTQVTLPGAAVRPIRVAERVLFVPVVAVNVLYEWSDGADGQADGQTAMSYVIGRENRPPAAKMAPFRLDQGPRMYREVGHRVHEMMRVA